MLISEMHDQIWGVYNHFYDKAFWLQESSGIPEELLLWFEGKSGKSTYVWDVGEVLPKLTVTEKDINLREDFKIVEKEFTNLADHEKLVDRIVEGVSSEVQLLYRFRNLIVHSAFKDQTLLPYFTWLAEMYSGVLLRSVRKDIRRGMTIDQSINQMSTIITRYKEHIGHGKIPCLDDDFLQAM